MEIYHVTDIASAKKILAGGIFIPYYVHYSLRHHNHDYCLNCFDSLDKAKNSPQPYKKGCMIVFEWSGEKVQYSLDKHGFPCEPDILYLDPSWRCFLPSGTTKYLAFKDIILEESIINEELTNEFFKTKSMKYLLKILSKDIILKFFNHKIQKKNKKTINSLYKNFMEWKGKSITVQD